MKRRSGQHDPLVVRTTQLAAVLRDWMDKHDRRFPYEQRDVNYGNSTGMSSRSYVSQWSGLDQRALWRVLSGETEWTSLSIADELLTAIDRRDVLDNEVMVVPNPRWTQEHWIEVMREKGCA